MRIGRGRPKNAISHRIAPNAKNQNSSPAQRRCVTVARAKAVKYVLLRIAQIDNRKTAKTNFAQRVGTVSGSDTGTNVRARATLRTTLRPRLELRFPRLFADLLFLAAKVAADYAELACQNQDGTAHDKTRSYGVLEFWSAVRGLNPSLHYSITPSLHFHYARPM